MDLGDTLLEWVVILDFASFGHKRALPQFLSLLRRCSLLETTDLFSKQTVTPSFFYADKSMNSILFVFSACIILTSSYYARVIELVRAHCAS